MTVKLLAFGITKDIIGERSSTLEVPDTISVKEFRAFITNKHPEFSKLSSLAIACNEEYALDEDIILDGTTVALIPPVSGG